MKSEKKLKGIRKVLDWGLYEAFPEAEQLHVIRNIVYGAHQDEEEPEPEFVPGDKVGVEGVVRDYEFRVDALEGHGGLKGQIKISTWVEPQDIEKI